MKTTKQIYEKGLSLAEKLKKKAKIRGIWENFGQKEVRELRDYAGNIYDYPTMSDKDGSDTRQQVEDIIGAFDDRCSHYTGR